MLFAMLFVVFLFLFTVPFTVTFPRLGARTNKVDICLVVLGRILVLTDKLVTTYVILNFEGLPFSNLNLSLGK